MMDVRFNKEKTLNALLYVANREAELDEVEVACLQDYNTLHPLPERDMTPDELYAAIEKEIDYIYAQD